MHWAVQIVGIACAVVGRVTIEIGVVVQSSLIDGEELMALDPSVV